MNKKVDMSFSSLHSLETLTKNAFVYYIGATVLSVVVAVFGFITTWIALKIFGYKQIIHDNKP